jgi:hypothetical protein
MGEVLQFRDAREPQRSFHFDLVAELEPSAYRASRQLPFRNMKHPRVKSAEETEGMLRDALERAQHHFDAGKNLVKEAQLLLERWRSISRRENLETRRSAVPGDREAESIDQRLNELRRVLERIAKGINDELGGIASATAGMFLSAPPADREPWSDTFAIEAGPWAVHLTGTARPAPELAIDIRAKVAAIASMELFLTLVRPVQGFQTVNLDSSGNGKVALPRGDSVMLVQGDEVWEVHLSFRD